MNYYKIIVGRHEGFIGRKVDEINGCFVLLIQTRDQWLFSYVKQNDLIKVDKWEICICNGTNYIQERA